MIHKDNSNTYSYHQGIKWSVFIRIILLSREENYEKYASCTTQG